MATESQERNIEQEHLNNPPGVEGGEPVATIAGGSSEQEEEVGDEMGFFDHLEELRWRIIKALIALVVSGVACAVFYPQLWQFLLRPATQSTPPIEFQNLVMFGQITLTIQVCLLAGLIIAIPFILWQFWAFIKPGLYKREQKYVGLIAVATIFCFLAGVSFSYFIMIPTALEFAQSFQVADQIRNDFTIEAYFSFILGFILAAGAIFEMPVLSWSLSRLGILTPLFMKKYRRHAIIVLLIVAAIVTPTPDPVNQLMMAGPLYILYEISIVVSRFATRQRRESLKEALGENPEPDQA
ncbi:MAG: twin-arginine translocase subunit TatC [Chlorobi bacterium]|nr:twin-arginine translocase subunit TatC [Chlorobiota bacterium]